MNCVFLEMAENMFERCGKKENTGWNELPIYELKSCRGGCRGVNILHLFPPEISFCISCSSTLVILRIFCSASIFECHDNKRLLQIRFVVLVAGRLHIGRLCLSRYVACPRTAKTSNRQNVGKSLFQLRRAVTVHRPMSEGVQSHDFDCRPASSLRRARPPATLRRSAALSLSAASSSLFAKFGQRNLLSVSP